MSEHDDFASDLRGDRYMHERPVSPLVQAFYGTIGVAVIGGIGWILLSITGLKEDVKTLLDRPRAESKEDHDRDVQVLDKRITRLEDKK